MSSTPGRRKLFVGRFIHAPSPDVLAINQGAILVEQDGTIGKISWDVDYSVEEARTAIGIKGEDVEFFLCEKEGFFFPGFIDTHIHAPQYPNCGIFGTSTLLDWLKTYTFPLESSFHNPNSPFYSTHPTPGPVAPLARAKDVYSRIISRTLAAGTTTASYYATIDVPATNLLADLCLSAGQRALIGRVCMDEARNCPDYYRDDGPDETVSKTIAVMEHCRKIDPKGEIVAPIVTPRFAPSCQRETLGKLGELVKKDREGLRVQTHISENLDEVNLVKQMFDGMEYADVYDRFGLLGEKTILAHAVHLSDEEVRLVKQRGSKVSHCPASNTSLGSGNCPVRRYRDEGIEVGLGTDVSGGFSVSVLEAVRQCCLVSRMVGFNHGGGEEGRKWNVGVTEGLWLATVGGARVVDMKGVTGRFEVGAKWDVQEIGLQGRGKVDVFGWESWEEKVAKWVWNGDDRNVRRVWVNGKLVHEGQ